WRLDAPDDERLLRRTLDPPQALSNFRRGFEAFLFSGKTPRRTARPTPFRERAERTHHSLARDVAGDRNDHIIRTVVFPEVAKQVASPHLAHAILRSQDRSTQAVLSVDQFVIEILRDFL